MSLRRFLRDFAGERDLRPGEETRIGLSEDGARLTVDTDEIYDSGGAFGAEAARDMWRELP